MVKRIFQGFAALALVISGLVIDAHDEPASAASSPIGYMYCGYSAALGQGVGFRGAQVTGEIAFRGGGPAIVYWRPEIYWYDRSAGQWRYWKTWEYRSAELQTNAGPTLGGTTGYAGPEWRGSDGTNSQFMFPAPSGYSYAIRHVVYDRGTWSYGWATMENGNTSCTF